MSEKVKDIVIVGGGTAGWLTAGILASQLKTDHPDGVRVTLVESPNVPTVGVGEGTWPTLRFALHNMGVDEAQFMAACDASFKHGSCFRNWTTDTGDTYYHPFDNPVGPVSTQWLAGERARPFAHTVSAQADLCDQYRAPKLAQMGPYKGAVNYGYHLDAGKFAGFLQAHCTQKLGVRHLLDDVTGVNAAPNGDIASVTTAENGALTGDLFVDCSGFRALLLGQHYGVGFRSCGDVLPIDRALAVQVPYATEDAPIAPMTLATAQTAGWIWDIGLTRRRGVGHVYSSAHTTDANAEDELAAYLRQSGQDIADLHARRIQFSPGHREVFWTKNCVAIGLSAGFLEPLEATALVLVEFSANMVAHQIPVTKAGMARAARRFNAKFLYRWERIIEFLKLHYVLGARRESDFWRDHKDPATSPDGLKDLLDHWRHYTPSRHDFDASSEMFLPGSYQYVLYGMGFETQPSHVATATYTVREAQKRIAENAAATRKMLAALPDHRAYFQGSAAVNAKKPLIFSTLGANV